MTTVDYSRYQTLDITRRGPAVDGVPSVLDIRMRADGPGGNGKLPTAGHEGHWELSEIWRDVGRAAVSAFRVGAISRWCRTWRRTSRCARGCGRKRATWSTT